MSKQVIQRVELNAFYDSSIYCPFCGQKVFDVEAADDGGDIGNPCPHTLFIAHDDGFEFRSPRFDEDLNIVGVEDYEIELPDYGIDGLTDSVTLADAVNFAASVGPPSGFGSYVGFAPLSD